MSSLLAQFSFLIAITLIGAGLLVLLWRWHNANPWLRAGCFAWYVFAVLVIALLFRYPATPDLKTPADVETVLTNGRPTFVMLYSNYCMGCMASLPAVMDLLPDLEAAQFNTLLLDVNTAPARDMLARFDFISTPTFLIFAADGTELSHFRRTPKRDEIFAVVQ